VSESTNGSSHADGDARDHLLTAAHEFLLALRALVDAADELVEQQRHAVRTPAAPRLRRIDIE
jgi:hypothetical protein